VLHRVQPDTGRADTCNQARVRQDFCGICPDFSPKNGGSGAKTQYPLEILDIYRKAGVDGETGKKFVWVLTSKTEY